jgi:putative ABC transport system ATP-binding protein
MLFWEESNPLPLHTMKKQPTQQNETTEFVQKRSIIEATNIHRTFVSGDIVTHVLKGIDISVAEGEFVAIMGKSGAGKSTLMYQLSILDRPTEGTLIVDGISMQELDEKEQTNFRLKTLGYVFQDYALVPDLNARENIMIPLIMRGMSWSDAINTADQALADVSLVGKSFNLPSQLSGGEQQRASIARAVAGKPKIIFADEPTANLDSISGETVVDLLGTLHNQGQTIVMVTHEEEYTKHCDRIIYMEDGKIVSIRKVKM